MERSAAITQWFLENRPNAETELHYANPYQLLVAVILSAQCTDKRVNSVTPAFFQRFPSADALAEASVQDVFPYIRSISYPNNKAKHLVGMARTLKDRFGSVVPSNIEELMQLPGVGRKTANVIASVVFNESVIAVDTHVFRVARRLGLSDGTTPRAVELDLERCFAPEVRARAHHWLILHGRYVCTARNPQCPCDLAAYCKKWEETRS